MIDDSVKYFLPSNIDSYLFVLPRDTALRVRKVARFLSTFRTADNAASELQKLLPSDAGWALKLQRSVNEEAARTAAAEALRKIAGTEETYPVGLPEDGAECAIGILAAAGPVNDLYVLEGVLSVIGRATGFTLDEVDDVAIARGASIRYADLRRAWAKKMFTLLDGETFPEITSN